MKYFSILSILFVLTGCFATQSAIETKPQEVVITVKSSDPVTVETNDDHISKAMEVHNPAGELSNLSFISGNRAFIKIFSGLSIADVMRFWNDIVFLENETNIRDVVLFINSGGGGAFDGLALADEIERVKKKGFNIIAHASGIIASAAVPVFAVCSKRYASEGTIFMVHEASLWKWPGQESASDIEAQGRLMKLLRDRYMDKMERNTKLTRDEWCAKEGRTTWFDANDARDWGLVDSIE